MWSEMKLTSDPWKEAKQNEIKKKLFNIEDFFFFGFLFLSYKKEGKKDYIELYIWWEEKRYSIMYIFVSLILNLFTLKFSLHWYHTDKKSQRKGKQK